jgi:hypothetical protein
MNPATSNTPSKNDSRPPDFPRPSSATSKTNLRNRMTARITNQSIGNESNNTLKVRDQPDSHLLNIHRGNTQSNEVISIKTSLPIPTSPLPKEEKTSNKLIPIKSSNNISKEIYGSITKASIIKSHTVNIPGATYLHSKTTSQQTNIEKETINKDESNEQTNQHIDIPLKYLKTSNNDLSINEILHMISSGQIEFCYLYPNPHEKYSYIASLTAPLEEHSKKITLSQYGITFFDSNDVEYVSLQDYMKEHDLYNKLQQISVVGKFRLWYVNSIYYYYIYVHVQYS